VTSIDNIIQRVDDLTPDLPYDAEKVGYVAAIEDVLGILREAEKEYGKKRLTCAEAEVAQARYERAEAGGTSSEPCPLCKRCRDDGDDPCIRGLPGVVYACCGHGHPDSLPYLTIAGEPSITVYGLAALVLMRALGGSPPDWPHRYSQVLLSTRATAADAACD
jgi:hypothetical protein